MGARSIKTYEAAEFLSLRDGSTAEIVDEALELRDREGRLLVRYVDGTAEISAPSRDLRLSAPNGRVVLDAGTDVAIHASRDLDQRAGRRLDLGAGDPVAEPQLRLEPGQTHVRTARLDVETHVSRVVTGKATVLARSITTTAELLAQNVGKYELTAT